MNTLDTFEESGAERAARLLNPGSIALVGASDRSRWSSTIFANLRDFGFQGRVALVNPKGGTVHGQTAATSCTALGERVDLGIVMVPQDAVPEVIEDLADACSAVSAKPTMSEKNTESLLRSRRSGLERLV